jgi:hypothetical protein
MGIDDRSDALSKKQPEKSYRKKKTRPDKCGKCGLGPEEEDFYPSEPNICKACHQERESIMKLKSQKTWKPIPENDPDLSSECPPSPEYDEFLKKTFAPRDTPTQTVILDFGRCSWALTWIRSCVSEGQTLEDVLVREIAEKVPGDWLKAHLLDGAR